MNILLFLGCGSSAPDKTYSDSGLDSYPQDSGIYSDSGWYEDSGDTDTDTDTVDTGTEDPCDSALTVGVAGQFSSETIELTWEDGLSRVALDFPNDLVSVAFHLDIGANYSIVNTLKSGNNILVDLNNDINIIKSSWEHEELNMVLPVSPASEPTPGCWIGEFIAETENEVPLNGTSELTLTSRRFTGGDTVVINFITANNSYISEEELTDVAQHSIDFLDLAGINADIYFDSVDTGAGSYITDGSSEMKELQSTQPPSLENATELNVYFLDDILDENGEAAGLYGFAGGVPGALGVQEVVSAGMVVSIETHVIDDNTLDTYEFGATIAHELGHQMGLFHTTEADGSSNDLLSDTPECNLTFDSNGDGSLSPSECQTVDGDHVMFWTAPSGAFVQENWSDQQYAVLSFSPVIVSQ